MVNGLSSPIYRPRKHMAGNSVTTFGPCQIMP